MDRIKKELRNESEVNWSFLFDEQNLKRLFYRQCFNIDSSISCNTINRSNRTKVKIWTFVLNFWLMTWQVKDKKAKISKKKLINFDVPFITWKKKLIYEYVCTIIDELNSLFMPYQLKVEKVKQQQEIPGSFWGDSEAGLIGQNL